MLDNVSFTEERENESNEKKLFVAIEHALDNNLNTVLVNCEDNEFVLFYDENESNWLVVHLDGFIMQLINGVLKSEAIASEAVDWCDGDIMRIKFASTEMTIQFKDKS